MPTVNFRLALDQFKHNTTANLEALSRQSIMELARRMVDATPVDTGFLRGSWQPSINAMVSLDPKKAAKAGKDKTGAVVNPKVAATVLGMKPGDKFFMSNNAAYALRMEFGFNGEDALGRSYRQPGRYFVTGTAAQWPQIVAQQAAALGLSSGGPPAGGVPTPTPASPGGGGSASKLNLPAPRKLGPVELPKPPRPRSQYDR
jgi:hypothetical protein